MPREIADSDAESDFNSPKRPSASPITEAVDEIQPLCTEEQDPFANLEFDQFLSPTQRLSSVIERHEATQSRLPSSTDKFLQEIAQADDGLLNSTGNNLSFDGSSEQASGAIMRNHAKRTMSDIEHGQNKRKHGVDLDQKSVKRTKTYGSSRSQKFDTSPLFSGSPGVHDNGDEEPATAQSHLRNNTNSSELPVLQLVDPEAAGVSRSIEPLAKSGYSTWNQQGATNFLQSNISTTYTTKSSMGGYAGINMDFRGAGLTLDMNANPFGSLSQVSLEGDVDPSQSERFASLFQHSQQPVFPPVAEDLHNTSIVQRSHLKEMATSPPQESNLNLEKTSLSHQMQLNGVGLDSAPPATEAPSKECMLDEGQKVENPEPKHKKRGRKPKSDMISKVQAPEFSLNVLQQLQEDDPLDLSPERYMPGPSRSRAGTVDSVRSHTSQISQAVDTNKRKRRKPTVHPTVEETAGNQPSSEPNLSDPAMIGVPKEMYAPRPSKSRSKRVVEDNEDELQKSQESNVEKALAKSKEPAQSPSTKRKPGRKSKVKRAKTSAAALLKSAEMYDEDDKDCILVDEMPAKVKMAAIPEISPVKKEAKDDILINQANHPGSPAIDEDKAYTEPQPEVQISVDIPKPAKSKDSDPAAATTATTTSNPEPKKRGRKPKAKPEVQIEPETKDPASEDPAAKNQPLPSIEPDMPRPALTELDPNTSKQPTPATPRSTSPKKPVHSPLKPSSTTMQSRSSTPSASGSLWSKPRVGLSRRTTIPSLLRKLDRSKEPPKTVERKEKLSKRQQEEEERRRLEAEDAGEDYLQSWEVRGKDGMLVEWDE